MSKCGVCSRNLNWFSFRDEHFRCAGCVEGNKWPIGHPKVDGAAERELAQQELDAIILTTETAPNQNIKSRVGIIMADADCSFTVKMVENNNALQSKLRSEAHSIGANAVVGITFDMIETYSASIGIGKVNTFKLIAYGTAVVIEDDEGV